MTGEFDVYPSSLRDAGQGLQDVAERVATAWQTLQAAVQGMGEMFGEDMVSSLIAASYGAAAEMAAESYASAAESLGGFGTGLAAIADQYTAADAGSAEEISGLGEAV